MRLLITLSLLLVPGSLQARTVATRVTLAPSRLDLSRKHLEGFRSRLTPAQPALPERDIAIALHPDVDLSSLRLEVKSGPIDTLPGRHELPPNPPHRIIWGNKVKLSWGTAKTIQAGRDLEAYGNKIFPANVIEKHRISDRRGFKVLHLRYMPLRYRHSGRELLLDKSTEVTVSYRTVNEHPFAPDPQLEPYLASVLNSKEAASWYRQQMVPLAAGIGYAIVIPDALAAASEVLPEFISHKETLGMTVTVVKDADRAAISVGANEGDAERIRGWLKQNYKALNLKYVLLIGNPDPQQSGVPMKVTYPLGDYEEEGYDMRPPTDYYYADLTGNWDINGNGMTGEYGADGPFGGVDFTPEVWVGRIPIYDNNAKALDKILAKSIAYTTDRGDKSWRGRVLVPASILFYDNQYGEPNSTRMDSADEAEDFYAKVLQPKGYSRTTLYEKSGVAPSTYSSDLPLTQENVIAEWQKGYGLVTWFGHGLPNGVYRTVWTQDFDNNKVPDYYEIDAPSFMDYYSINLLDDSRPAFVFHGSCSNGEPEQADNIGYGLLLNGAVGTASSSRVAMGIIAQSAASKSEGIFAVERTFGEQMLEKKSVGEALLYAKENTNQSWDAYGWYTRFEINLYGDPSLSLTACTGDGECDDGKACNGKETCKAGQCQAGTPVSCPLSSESCVVNRCDEASGACVSTPLADGEACDDLQFCTINDACQSGHCSGEPRCSAPGNPCVSASCDEANRTCKTDPVLEGQTCNAGTEREGLCKTGLCAVGLSSQGGGCAVSARTEAERFSGGWVGLTLLLLFSSLVIFRRRISARSR